MSGVKPRASALLAAERGTHPFLGAVYNIAEATMHVSRLIDRVEHGEQITIARNNRPVAIVSPATTTPKDIQARIDAVREPIRERNGGKVVLKSGETWRALIEEGRRV